LPFLTFLHRFLCEEKKYAVMSFSYCMRWTVPFDSPGHGFFFPRGLACGPNPLPVRICSTPVSDVPQQAICGSNIAYQACMRKFCHKTHIGHQRWKPWILGTLLRRDATRP
jgi:hypothetical protein